MHSNSIICSETHRNKYIVVYIHTSSQKYIDTSIQICILNKNNTNNQRQKHTHTNTQIYTHRHTHIHTYTSKQIVTKVYI